MGNKNCFLIDTHFLITFGAGLLFGGWDFNVSSILVKKIVSLGTNEAVQDEKGTSLLLLLVRYVRRNR